MSLKNGLYYLITGITLVFFFSLNSCRKDFGTVPSSGQLEFSRDTVYLDTVFTNIGSATYNLKVYNRSGQDITIPTITLEKGSASKYRMNVDGIPGKEFQNIDILAKDSIFIFVETTIDITSVSNPLYTDRILFDTGELQQDVDLVTLVQDANFIYPGRDAFTKKIDSLSLDGKPTTIKGRFLTDGELTFTKDKPYVIYGFSAVPATKTLTIEAGTKVHFHNNSGLLIDDGASLKVSGTLNEKVVFEGDRLEHAFSTISGQWGTIWFREGSTNNELHHTQIKNGIVGILVDGNASASTAKLILKNVEIYNHSNYGLLGRATSIDAENLVVGNAGQTSLALTVGGTYEFTHSTFANYWSNGIRTLPTVLVNNFLAYTNNNGDEIIEPNDLIKANFTNCIIDGSNNIELLFDRVDGSNFNFKIANSLIKFNDTDGTYDSISEMDFSNTTFYQSVLLNGNPNFRFPQQNDFIIGTGSDAINKGNSTGAVKVPLDILGVSRTSTPDLGAYQHIEF